MRRSISLTWLLFGAGCTFDPGAAQYALMQGNMRALQKDYAGAIGLYDQALMNDPSLAEACFNRGIAYRNKGNYERAMADIVQSINMGLDGSRVYTEVARIKLAKIASDTAASGDKTKFVNAFGPDDPYGIGADLEHAIALVDEENRDGVTLLLHGAFLLMQNRESDADKDFDRYLLRRPKARDDLIEAVRKWRNERPILDLSPIDDLGRIPARVITAGSATGAIVGR